MVLGAPILSLPRGVGVKGWGRGEKSRAGKRNYTSATCTHSKSRSGPTIVSSLDPEMGNKPES